MLAERRPVCTFQTLCIDPPIICPIQSWMSLFFCRKDEELVQKALPRKDTTITLLHKDRLDGDARTSDGQ